MIVLVPVVLQPGRRGGGSIEAIQRCRVERPTRRKTPSRVGGELRIAASTYLHTLRRVSTLGVITAGQTADRRGLTDFLERSIAILKGG